jgi:hypothetical protein
MKRGAALGAGISLGLVLGTGGTAHAVAAVYEVDNATDPPVGNGIDCITIPGNCSLRDAVDVASADGEDSKITFKTTLTGVTIPVGAPLGVGADSGHPTNIYGTSVAGTKIDGGGHQGLFRLYDGSLSLHNLTLTGGAASPDGLGFGGDGGVVGPGGDYVGIFDSRVTGNSALYGGGAISMVGGGAVEIDRSTVDGNSAVSGGAVYVGTADVTFKSSTITGNTASSSGGAVATSSIAGTTISALYSTIAGNTGSSSGGGLDNDEADGTVLFGSILADNTAPAGKDTTAGVTADDSLVEAPVGAVTPLLPPGHNLVGTDPKLGALGANGGPLPTKRPAWNSPLIDASFSSNATTPLDERGLARIVDIPGRPNVAGAGTDMGAVELTLAEAAAHTTSTAVSCAPATVTLPGSSDCTVTVGDTFVTGPGQPVGDVAVSADAGGSLSAASCTLAAAGPTTSSCHVTFTPATAGDHTITAVFAGDGAIFSGSNSAAMVTSQLPAPAGPGTQPPGTGSPSGAKKKCKKKKGKHRIAAAAKKKCKKKKRK